MNENGFSELKPRVLLAFTFTNQPIWSRRTESLSDPWFSVGPKKPRKVRIITGIFPDWFRCFTVQIYFHDWCQAMSRSQNLETRRGRLKHPSPVFRFYSVYPQNAHGRNNALILRSCGGARVYLLSGVDPKWRETSAVFVSTSHILESRSSKIKTNGCFCRL